MSTVRRRALGSVAALGLLLGACTATVPHAESPVGDRVVPEAAPGGAGQVPLLNMQDVSAVLNGSEEDVEVHVTVAVTGMGETLPAMEFTTTTDSGTGRFAYRSEAVDVPVADGGDTVASIPASEMIGEQTDDGGVDLYVRAGDATDWVRIVVDPALSGETAVFGEPGRILESFELTDVPGLEFTEDGTGSHAGQTMTRQVATLDFMDMLDEAMPGGLGEDSDGFAEMMDGMFDTEDLAAFLPTGTVELLVDTDATPRRVDIELSMGGGAGGDDLDFSASMRSVMTIDPAPGGGIGLPAADAVSETVIVDSYSDLTDALGALSGALAWN